MKSFIAVSAVALMLCSCGTTRHETVAVNVGAGGVYDGYYDGYYGPYNDGYWGDDGFFYYADNDHNWRRDDSHHFRRDTATGFNHVVVHVRPADAHMGDRP